MSPGHKDTAKPPKCSGERKDGSPCNTHAIEDGLCAWHLAKRDEGPQPEPSPRDRVVDLLPIEPTADDEALGTLEVVGDVRGALRAGADANSDKIVASLLEVLNAYTERKVRCPCGCGYEFAVRLPEGTARVQAAKVLVELGHGPTPRDDTAKTESAVDLNFDPATCNDSEFLAAYVQNLIRQYPEDVRSFNAKTKLPKREQTEPLSGAAGVPRKRRAQP